MGKVCALFGIHSEGRTHKIGSLNRENYTKFVIHFNKTKMRMLLPRKRNFVKTTNDEKSKVCLYEIYSKCISKRTLLKINLP